MDDRARTHRVVQLATGAGVLALCWYLGVIWISLAGSLVILSWRPRSIFLLLPAVAALGALVHLRSIAASTPATLEVPLRAGASAHFDPRREYEPRVVYPGPVDIQADAADREVAWARVNFHVAPSASGTTLTITCRPGRPPLILGNGWPARYTQGHRIELRALEATGFGPDARLRIAVRTRPSRYWRDRKHPAEAVLLWGLLVPLLAFWPIEVGRTYWPDDPIASP